VSSTAPPSITSVTFGGAATSANTTGGTLLVIAGSNFGHLDNFTRVSIRVPAGDLLTSNCTLVTNGTLLQCVMPMATGALSLVSLAVLGQATTFSPAGLAYAAPVINVATPSTVPTTGATITLSGLNFGFELSDLVLIVNGMSAPVSMPVSNFIYS
jgi:hypothetical protein